MLRKKRSPEATIVSGLIIPFSCSTQSLSPSIPNQRKISHKNPPPLRTIEQQQQQQEPGTNRPPRRETPTTHNPHRAPANSNRRPSPSTLLRSPRRRHPVRRAHRGAGLLGGPRRPGTRAPLDRYAGYRLRVISRRLGHRAGRGRDPVQGVVDCSCCGGVGLAEVLFFLTFFLSFLGGRGGLRGGEGSNFLKKIKC